METRFRQEKAITLIALVVTVIVLLILAGVSINMLTGQNRNTKKSIRSKRRNRFIARFRIFKIKGNRSLNRLLSRKRLNRRR